MVTLRSRQIPSPTSKSVPLTPAQIREPPTRQSPPSYKSETTGSTNKKRNVGRMEEQHEAIQAEQNVCEADAEKDNCLSLRSGKRVVKRRVEYSSCGDELITEIDGENKNPGVEEKASHKRSVAKGKGKLSEENQCAVDENFNLRAMNELREKLFINDNQIGSDLMRKRRYSREEKGKEKLEGDDDDDALLKSNANDALQLEFKVKELVDSVTTSLENERQTRSLNRDPITKDRQLTRKNESRMDRFHEIARKNASRFAHFNHPEHEEEEEQFQLPSESDADVQVMPDVEENEKVEDWPGPFSTAMKIIRDRADKLNSQQQGTSTLGKVQSVPITWVPKRDSREDMHRPRAPVPSLQQLCMEIIVKNVDAVSSVEHVPDALRHRLCHLLCDCRKMNPCFFDLLVRGSPTEIRVRDCSWMTEEEFMKCFEGTDTSNLTVLQLDQCGRCLPDYVLPATLARSARSLPALLTLSLCGACRLSDFGLKSLVSSAVALRSVNLSQCSLLTSTSIGTLADSLGSVLRELYIDDCQSLDAMHILPSLKKLEHLEVLSVAGIPTVCDDFVQQFVVACGHNIKELGLADCMKLTDSSLRVIAETCPHLCALDVVNLRKLTDSALGYLVNGCREIQTLKLCRNVFSDDGIAAFVESSGELLKELSLNNVKKVGHNTAISLARRSRNLTSLDLSWCRELTDQAVGLIVDSCLSLRVLKLFGCGQITNVFLNGHSNPEVKIIGLTMSPVLEHLWVPDSHEFPLRYSSFMQNMV